MRHLLPRLLLAAAALALYTGCATTGGYQRAAMPTPDQVAAPEPIEGNGGAFLSPYTTDGVTAKWVDKGLHAQVGAGVGSAVGGAAASLAAQQLASNIPGLSLFAGAIGSAVGGAIGREAALAAVGGEQYMRETSDLSFPSLEAMAQWMYANFGHTPNYAQVVQQVGQVYTEFAEGHDAWIASAPRRTAAAAPRTAVARAPAAAAPAEDAEATRAQRESDALLLAMKGVDGSPPARAGAAPARIPQLKPLAGSGGTVGGLALKPVGGGAPAPRGFALALKPVGSGAGAADVQPASGTQQAAAVQAVGTGFALALKPVAGGAAPAPAPTQVARLDLPPPPRGMKLRASAPAGPATYVTGPAARLDRTTPRADGHLYLRLEGPADCRATVGGAELALANRAYVDVPLDAHDLQVTSTCSAELQVLKGRSDRIHHIVYLERGQPAAVSLDAF